MAPVIIQGRTITNQVHNWQEPYSELSLSQLYERLTGKRGKRRGDEVQFECVNHPDEHPSLFINDGKGVGYCFGCDWRFNRYTLVKEWGGDSFGKTIHSNPVKYSNYSESFSRANTLVEALRQIGRLKDANEIESCASEAEVWRCDECGEQFVRFLHCDNQLCPLCSARHIERFFKVHSELCFEPGVYGLTLSFPGKVLGKDSGDKVGDFQAYAKEIIRELAWLRKKLKATNTLQDMVYSRQFKAKKGILWIKVHILVDCLKQDIELLRNHFSSRYPWKPLRVVRAFDDGDKAIAWLKEKARHPLEEWEEPEDLGMFLDATKHMPLIQGLGTFHKVKGRRGMDQKTKQDTRTRQKELPPSCPHCGGRNIHWVGLIPRDEVWIFDRRFKPPSSAAFDACLDSR